jgi:hypothetical protein
MINASAEAEMARGKARRVQADIVAKAEAECLSLKAAAIEEVRVLKAKVEEEVKFQAQKHVEERVREQFAVNAAELGAAPATIPDVPCTEEKAWELVDSPSLITSAHPASTGDGQNIGEPDAEWDLIL